MLDSESPKMSGKQITIVTTTFNCIGELPGYFSAFAKLDPTRFDWVVVDAGSTDGTADFLRQRGGLFTHFVSEPDAGFYFGLNKAVAAVRTPYYIVFGADDRPSRSLLDEVLPLLANEASLVLGAVRLMPGGRLKRPGPRWLHRILVSRAMSHHSVGTVIKTDVHQRFGRYDTAFSLLADSLLIKRILSSDEPICRADAVFGEFMLGGMSTKQELRSMSEIFLLQVSEGSNAVVQASLLVARVVKREVQKIARRLA